MRCVRSALVQGDCPEAFAALQKQEPAERNKILHLCEMGTLCNAMGDYKGSNQALLAGVNIGREYDDRARVSLRDGAAFAAALMLNDRTIPYRGSPFERVMMHTYLATNFLLLRDLEGARVEILRAYARQKEMREEHEKRIARTKEEAANRSLNMAGIMDKVSENFSDQRELLKKAGNVYQNAFTYYLSALVYELGDETDDAYIDYKTVHALNPDFRPAWTDLLRCSKKLGFRDDYAHWRERFGSDMPDSTPAGHGEIVLLYQCGLAPEKKEIRFVVPIPVNNRIHPVHIAFPKYESQPNPFRGARLRLDGREAGTTYPLVDLEATAVRDLWDQAPEIALRAGLRAAGRVAASEAARKQQNGAFGVLAVFLAGAILDRADLRSWLTLPRDIQVLRVSAPAGAHDVELNLIGGGSLGAISLKDVPVRAGRITLVNLRSVGVHGKADYVAF